MRLRKPVVFRACPPPRLTIWRGGRLRDSTTPTTAPPPATRRAKPHLRPRIDYRSWPESWPTAIRRRGSRSAHGTCPDGTDVAPSAGQAGNPPNAGPAHCARSPIKPPLSPTPQHHRIPPVPLIRRHHGEHDDYPRTSTSRPRGAPAVFRCRLRPQHRTDPSDLPVGGKGLRRSAGAGGTAHPSIPCA
jgi:hypothetical protein